MQTYTAHATMRDKTTRPVQVQAGCAVEARRLMFAMSGFIASITSPRVVGEDAARHEYMRRHGDEEN